VTFRDDLEAQIREHFLDADLAVYADLLQAEGDVRGDLIALDLAPELSDDWQKRRAALLVEWVGRELATVISSRLSRGFITSSAHDLLAIVRSPAGTYLRSIELHDGVKNTAALAALASVPLPFLTRLSLRDDAPRKPYDAEVIGRLIERTPHLVELRLAGTGIVDHFDHPTVQRLVLAPTAIRQLVDARFERVVELVPAALAGLERDSFPCLARLDLSAWPTTGGALSALLQTPLRDQITHLAIPGITSVAELNAVERTLANLPRLVELSAPRAHESTVDPQRLARADLRIAIPPPFPWPKRRNPGLTFGLPESGELELYPVPLLAERFDALAPNVRAAWIDIWSLAITTSANDYNSDYAELDGQYDDDGDGDAAPPGVVRPTIALGLLRCAIAGVSRHAIGPIADRLEEIAFLDDAERVPVSLA